METQQHNIFYKDDTFSLEYQILNQETVIVHMYVKSFTHNKVKQWYREAVRLYEYLQQEGYSEIITASPNARLVERFNGKKLYSVEHDGKVYEVFKWDLKQQP